MLFQRPESSDEFFLGNDYPVTVQPYFTDLVTSAGCYRFIVRPVNLNGIEGADSQLIVPVETECIILDRDGDGIPDYQDRCPDDINKTSPGNANIGNLFRYDYTTGQYIYNLSTKGYTNGTYRIIAATDKGSSYSVNFSLK